MGYGSDATDPFTEAPGFQCSWTQFEYYHGHREKKDLIAFVCAPELSAPGFVEEGGAAELARKQRLQQEHRARVASGMFDGTPLAGKIGRTSNEQVDSVQALLKAVAAAVGTLHRLGDSAKAASTEAHHFGQCAGELKDVRIDKQPPLHSCGGSGMSLRRVLNSSSVSQRVASGSFKFRAASRT